MVEPAYRYRAKLVRAIDADTLVLNIDLGFRVFVELELRVHAVDAPEQSTPEGKEATAWASSVLRHPDGSSRLLIVESFKDQRSFARWVGTVYVDGDDYAGLLRAAGHVKR